ncbi:MAG: trans-sulfuration enzyme family protein, partial [Candidatus Kapaibacterium sp.]
ASAIRSALQPNTRMLYTETPTNPMMSITDIRMVAGIAKEASAMLVVDNTFATPYFQRPLTLGADIVIHSATKYLGGHSDLIHGIVVTSSTDIADRLRFIQNAAGAVPGPFECWLLLRSSKTLALRMRQHAENAMCIADVLSADDRIGAVHYPGLPTHPQHALAASQMSGFGGIISIELGSLERARAFTNALRIFTLGESLGGVESRVCHPVSMTHGSIPPNQRLRLGITDGLVRLSVGVEDVHDLVADVRHALLSLSA